MTKYINKAAVVAEIEGRLKVLNKDRDFNYLQTKELEVLLSFLNTLEVKEVEEETISEDLEYAALLHYPKMSRISEPHGFIPADNKSHYLGDANEDNRKAFIAGAQWQKEQDQSTIELAEDHSYFAGSENTRKKLIDKACEWLKNNWRKHVWLDGDNIIHFGLWEKDFRKTMEE
jgi:hypothetical protein